MTPSLPKLRSDLDRRQQPGADGSTLIIKDPVSGEFYRMGAAEGFIAEQLDGETPLDAIQGRVEEKFGAKLTAEALAGFIKMLGRQGLLDTGETAPQTRSLVQIDSQTAVVHAISKKSTSIGRAGDNDILIDAHDASRHHACLVTEPNATVIDDLGSTNGVYVNNHRVNQRQALRDGDIVLIGKTRFRFAVKPAERERSAGAPRRGRLAGNMLYLRCKLLDPQRLLDRLIRRTRFFFTPYFVVLSAGVILTALVLTVFNWGDIIDQAAKLYQLSTLPLLVVTVFLVISAHEFAHGLTCRHFGGEVREMGFLLMYFQPALYCNVSDAWLFPEKSKRLWVGFAGPYFEMFLWALATLAWRATDSDTWISRASLVVMATSGMKTFFNFNPLIKLDGYYLLSDYLDIPNLRKKSFAYLGDFLKRTGGSARRLTEVSRREKRIFLSYGLTAWLFSISLLSYIGLIAGEYLIVEQQRVAFFALTALIGFRFRDKLRSLFGRKSEGSDSSHRSRRTIMSLRRPLVALAVVGAAALLLFGVQMELRVAGPINVLPHHNADVRTEIDGVIEEIFVDEGQLVRKGDPIARLYDREYRSELQKTAAQIQQVRAMLDQLIAGPTREEIQVARSAVTKAEDRLTFAQAKRARNEALFQPQLVSRNDLDTARELESTASNELAEAKSRLQVLLDGTRPEAIAATRAEFARLQAQQDFLDGQLLRINVLSPASGVVTTPNRQLRAMVRQAVSKGGLIAKVHDLKIVIVETTMSEKEIADVKVGQRAAIKTRAYPDRIFYGKVTAIAPTAQGSAGGDASGQSTSATSSPGDADKNATSIRVTTEIDNSAGLLKPGMTGMAKIYCGQRRIIDLVTRRLSRTFRVEFWSWW